MKHSKGFTLLEVIIAIAVISVLMSIGTSIVTNRINAARLSDDQATVTTITNIVADYKSRPIYEADLAAREIQLNSILVNVKDEETAEYKAISMYDYLLEYSGCGYAIGVNLSPSDARLALMNLLMCQSDLEVKNNKIEAPRSSGNKFVYDIINGSVAVVPEEAENETATFEAQNVYAVNMVLNTDYNSFTEQAYYNAKTDNLNTTKLPETIN